MADRNESYMTPEQRLKALEELEQRQQRNQQRVAKSVWTSIVVGVVVLGAVLATATWQLTSVRSEINALDVQKGNLQTDVADLQKQKETAEAARLKAEEQRKAVAVALSYLPAGQLQTAIDKQIAATPRTATLLPRIYLHTVDRADTSRADSVRKKLQEAGYVVLGIEYVPTAKNLKRTDVRFYHATERPEAEKIARVMNDAGEPNAFVNYLEQYENDPKARANHFEVWLASNGQPQQQYPTASTEPIRSPRPRR